MASITSNVVTGNASVGANWVGGVAPVDGDTVIIPVGAIITLDVNIILGSKAAGVGHAFTINGTAAATFGTLKVAAGVTVTLRGFDLVNNTIGLINRYAVFQPLPGSIVAGDVAGDYTSKLLNKGIINAVGTVGNPVTFTIPAATAAASWNNQVTAEATVTSGASSFYDLSSTPRLYTVYMLKSWIANVAGTGPGSFGDSSLSFPSTTGIVSGLTHEVASIAAISAAGDFYVDYDRAVVWFNGTGAGAITVQSTYKRLAMSNDWGIESIQNTDYNQAIFDYCLFQYMGTQANFENYALAVTNKNSAASAANRLFQLTNSTVRWCGTFLGIKSSNGTAADYIRVENNTFNECLGGQFGNHVAFFRAQNTYVSVSNNVLNTRSGAFINTAAFAQTLDYTGCKFNGNTGNCSCFLFNGTSLTGTGATSICTFSGAVMSGNVLTGIGKSYDANLIVCFGGNATAVAIISGNTFLRCKRYVNAAPYLTIDKNVFFACYHHGIIPLVSSAVGYINNVTITNNQISGGSCDAPYIQLGYNASGHCDNWIIANNTLNGAGLEFGDSVDQQGCGVVTNLQMYNNVCLNGNNSVAFGGAGIRKGADTTTWRQRVHCTVVRNNLIYNPNTSNYVGITHQTTFRRNSLDYNLDLTRGLLGIALFDASYSSPPAAKALAMVVNSPDADVTLAWGGGTPVQLIFPTSGVGAVNSATTTTITVSAATWSTNLNSAACPRCCWVKITTGTGAGQIRAIVGNTVTQLTVSQAWTVTPDAASTYVIYQLEVQLFDSGGTDYIRAGIYLPSLPSANITDSGITMTFDELFSNPALPVGSSSNDSTPANHQPAIGSPVVAAGYAVGFPTTDYFGKSRSSPPTIGFAEILGALYTSLATGIWTDPTKWTPTPGSNGPSVNDVAIIATGHTITLADGTTVSCGTGAPTSPVTVATFVATGGSVTSLPTGAYILTYSHVDSAGRESSPSPPTAALSLTNGVSAPLATFPVLPAGAVSRKVYLTNTGGAAQTERLYATGITALTFSPTSASWTNGTGTYAAAAPTPLSSCVFIKGTGKLVIGQTTGAIFNRLGDIILGATAVTRTVGFYQLTMNPGSTLNHDSSSASALANYVVGPNQSNAPDTRIQILGTTGAHCTITSNVAGGNGWFSNRGFNTRVGSFTMTFTDLVRIGDATNDAFQPYPSTVTTEPDTFSLHDCTLTSCGLIDMINNMQAGCVFSLQRVICASSAGTNVLSISGVNGLTTGTGEIQSCSFDKAVVLLNPLNWNIGHPSDSTKGNYFASRIGSSGNKVWGCFNGNFVNVPGPGYTLTLSGSATNSYIFDNNAAGTNPDTLQPHASLTAGTYPISGNIFEFNGADGSGDFLNPPSNCANVCVFNVNFNLILPAPGFPSAGWKTSGKLFGALGGTNQTFRFDHNTVANGAGDFAAVYVGDAFNPPSGYILSLSGNSFWDTIANRAQPIYNRHDTGSDNGNVVAPANCNRNGLWNQSTTLYPGSGTAAGTVYGLSMSGSAPGANDVNANPQFFDTTRRLRTWGVTVGADGTDAGALAKLAANPSLIANLMTWVSAGWRPTNSAYANVTGPLDTAQGYTVDMAGNALGGTIGALAYVSTATGGVYPFFEDNEMSGGFFDMGF